jgi:uncharacterized protein YecT (DUF1311 family)
VSNKDVKQDALDNLADALTEDILNTPDDELLREVEEDYGDRRALANKLDQILERAERQIFGTARPAAPPPVRSSFLDRLLQWYSTLFGGGLGRSGTQFQLSSVNSTVWAGAAAVMIILILGPAVFLSISEFNERSTQLAALEKEQLARSEQLAAQERELLARSEQLVAREKEHMVPRAGLDAQAEGEAAQAEVQAPMAAQLGGPALAPPVTDPKLCEKLTEPFEHLICADADLAFWQNLVSEIYQHRWRQLDTNRQQILRQGQLDWLRNMRVGCNVPETGTWNAAEMARAKSCVLQSTKERVAVLSNN